MLAELTEIFAGDVIGPRPEGGGAPRIVVGGHVPQAFARTAKWGSGWIAGGATPDQFKEMADGVNQAWSDAGREGKPHLMGLAYFALGDGGAENAQSYLTDYYAFLGEEVANMIAGSAALDADTVAGYMAAFEAVGCDELVFFPCSSDPGQVDLLAAAAGR